MQLAGAVRRRRSRDDIIGFALNSPAIVLLLVMATFPIIWSFWLSLHSLNLRRPHRTRFVGLDNYIEQLTSAESGRRCTSPSSLPSARSSSAR